MRLLTKSGVAYAHHNNNKNTLVNAHHNSWKNTAGDGTP